MSKKEDYKYGNLESVKFNHRRKKFYNYVDYLNKSEVKIEDIIFNSTSYIGHMSLNRILTLYELYKLTSNLAGHIADVGIYKGGSSFLFAKLIKIFESESHTLCHGFDWFKGQLVGEKDSKLTTDGGYYSEFNQIKKLNKLQQLDNILKIHNLDLRSEICKFFETHQHLRFKLINMDCGKYDVVKSCLPFFWERLNKGGIMVFDQYSYELAPGETLAIHELLPEIEIRSMKNSWTPIAYTIK